MTDVRTRDPARWRVVLRRWPTLVGLLAAASQVLTGADRTTVAIIVAVAVICYLAAAALSRPWAAWAAVPGCALVITGSELSGAEPLTTLAVTAAALVVVGLIGRASRAALTAETLGVLGYGSLVMIGLVIDPAIGLVLVASTLIAHGIWDVVHLWRKVVVARSFAEACVALDIPLGLAVIVVLLTT